MSWQPTAGRYAGGMETALYVIVAVVSLATAGLVAYMFVWAARKDGEDDRAVQKKLGIRRKTRLGL
jgi:ABC-type uncharacterized transport system permease subunit